MKKRSLVFVVILIIALCAIAVGCDKTKKNTHKGVITVEINTVSDFLNIKNQLGSDYDKATFKLMNDLDFSDINDYEAIGNSYENSFRSIFDGNNKKITNLSITKGKEFFGVFGYTVNAVIKDLTIESLSIALPVVEKDIFIGGLVSHAVEKLEINQVKVDANIDITMAYETITGENDIRYEFSDNEYIGGILGYGLGEIIIENTESSMFLDNEHDEDAMEYDKPKVNIKSLFAGGMVGYIRGNNENSKIEKAKAVSQMNLYSDKSSIGGLIGYSDNVAINDVEANIAENIIVNSYVRTNVGGLVGVASNTNIVNSKTNIAKMTLKNNYGNIGGLVGYSDKGTSIDNTTVNCNFFINDSMKNIALGGVIGNMIDSKLQNVSTVTGKILSNNNELDYTKESTEKNRYIAGLVGRIFGESTLKASKTELKAYQGAVGILIVNTIPAKDDIPAITHTPVIENATVLFLKGNCLAQDRLDGSRIKNKYGTEVEDFTFSNENGGENIPKVE